MQNKLKKHNLTWISVIIFSVITAILLNILPIQKFAGGCHPISHEASDEVFNDPTINDLSTQLCVEPYTKKLNEYDHGLSEFCFMILIVLGVTNLIFGKKPLLLGSIVLGSLCFGGLAFSYLSIIGHGDSNCVTKVGNILCIVLATLACLVCYILAISKSGASDTKSKTRKPKSQRKPRS